jgi:SAM-dependent methyltransferase
MRPSERVLLALSRKPEPMEARGTTERWTIETALTRLERFFPDFRAALRGKDIVDFGAGEGFQAAAMVQAGARRVVGIESNLRVLDVARSRWARLIEEGRLGFAAAVKDEHTNAFDLAVSQDSMEHFSDPLGILQLLRRILRPSGRVCITFSPPWYSPYGAHMSFFTQVPWVHLLFSERTVMAVRSRFRSDGARRYEEVEGGLNRMSLRRFEALAPAAGFEVAWRSYRCVKDVNILGRVPILRELFVERVDCVLQPAPR